MHEVQETAGVGLEVSITPPPPTYINYLEILSFKRRPGFNQVYKIVVVGEPKTGKVCNTFQFAK